MNPLPRMHARRHHAAVGRAALLTALLHAPVLAGAQGTAAPTEGSGFAALDARGRPTTPKAGNRPHPCVLDRSTGLVWEVKTNDKGPGHQEWTYTWFDRSKSDQGYPAGYADRGFCADKGQCDTAGYVAATNRRRLCGFDDWRLPTADELQGLLRPGQPARIDPRFFPNTPATYFWTGSYVALEVGGAMFVSFDHGMVLPGNSAAAAALRLVRGPGAR